jgi:cation-transporting ATPase 13A2
MKNPLPCDGKRFSFNSHKKFMLFNGTVLNKCESNNSSGLIRALVINTGFNTLRGNLIQNLLFPKESNFNLYSDLKFFFFGMIFVYLLTISIAIFFYKKFNPSSVIDVDNPYQKELSDCPGLGTEGPATWTIHKLVKVILFLLTVILPPTLPISLTFTNFYFDLNLNRNNISCISEKRMNAAGKVNILVLDKTGTLTEEGLDLHGFQITKVNKEDMTLGIDLVETDTTVFNSIHMEFWKKYCYDPFDPIFNNYQTNLVNNIIYFIECLATCHTIDKIKDDYLGNSIDKKIFDNLKWLQEKSEESNHGNVMV